MRSIWIVLLFAVPALAGCMADDSDDTPIETEPPTVTLAPGVDLLTLGNATATDLLASAQGTYYSIGDATFEPTLGVTSSGALFMAAFEGLGSGTQIRRSLDQGQTWDDATPTLPTGMKAVPNSNDPFIYVDPATDRVYDFDMCLILSGFCLSYSDDDGQTWTTYSVATGEGPALDHQSMAAAPASTAVPTTVYPNVLTFCVNRGPTAVGAWCSSSFDGGAAWTPLVPGYPVGTPQCSGLSGHVWGASDGTFYRGNPACGGPAVYKSTDGGQTWSEHVITSDLGSLSHEIAVAADGEGGVYAFWIGDDGLPYLAVSDDHAETWGAPVKVGHSDVTAAGFPTIASGAPGHVAFAYIGTDVEDGYNGAQADMEWTGYLGISTDAKPDGLNVANVPVNAEDDPLDEGRPCGAIRCGGFGDFIDVVIDADGRPWAALAHNGQGSAGIVGTLQTGPSLTGNGTLQALPAGGASAWE